MRAALAEALEHVPVGARERLEAKKAGHSISLLAAKHKVSRKRLNQLWLDVTRGVKTFEPEDRSELPEWEREEQKGAPGSTKTSPPSPGAPSDTFEDIPEAPPAASSGPSDEGGEGGDDGVVHEGEVLDPEEAAEAEDNPDWKPHRRFTEAEHNAAAKEAEGVRKTLNLFFDKLKLGALDEIEVDAIDHNTKNVLAEYQTRIPSIIGFTLSGIAVVGPRVAKGVGMIIDWVREMRGESSSAPPADESGAEAPGATASAPGDQGPVTEERWAPVPQGDPEFREAN
jgi:hypothetical protein